MAGREPKLISKKLSVAITDMFSRCRDQAGDDFSNALIPVNIFYEKDSNALTEYFIVRWKNYFSFEIGLANYWG